MSDSVTPERLSVLLNDTMELGLGPRATPTLGSGTGLRPAPPHDGGIEQGTYSGNFSGGVKAFVSDLSLGVDSLTVGSKPDQGDHLKFSQAIAPVRLLLADSGFLSNSCCGVIGKSGKFCTRRRDDSGDTTCGIRAHVKKGEVAESHIYFWEETSNVAHLTPAMDSRIKLAEAIWDMRGEDLTRIQFVELMEAAITGDASSVTELAEIKTRVLDPTSKISFTPRKKPRYSTDAWEFPDLQVLEEIPEIPGGLDDFAVQDHIAGHWKSLVTTVESLKSVAGRNSKYETELDSLGGDIDGLRSALARMQTLLGHPADGLSFDLYAIVGGTEDTVSELEVKIKNSLGPKVTEVEAKLIVLQGELKKFRSSTGDELLTRLAHLETSVRVLESTATPDTLAKVVVKLQSVVGQQIIPAVRNLWEFYELMTTGNVGSCTPGVAHDVGKVLNGRLAAVETFARDTGSRLHNLETGGVTSHPAGSNSVVSLTQRVLTLERNLADGRGGGDSSGGELHDGLSDLFGHRAPVGAPGPGVRAPASSSESDDPRWGRLEAKIRDLEAQMDNVTVSMGGFTFKSVDDCEAFVVGHVPGNTYAYFYDVVSLLQRGWGHNHVAVMDVWEKTHAIKKAGFTSRGEAVILASMATVLPSCLGELTGKNSECHLPLPALSSYESWTHKGFQMGRRKDIQDGLNRVVTTLEDNVRDVFRGFEQGRCVANEMLSLSRSHWSQIERMIDNFYGEFHVTSNEKDAWKLTSLIAKTVFEAVHQARAIGSDLSDILSPSKRAAKVMWATLQAHRVMRTFIDADFRNDPRIAPVIVLHLLENRVGRQDFDLLKAKAQAQSLQLTKQGAAIDKLITLTNELKRTKGKGGGRGSGGQRDQDGTDEG